LPPLLALLPAPFLLLFRARLNAMNAKMASAPMPTDVTEAIMIVFRRLSLSLSSPPSLAPCLSVGWLKPVPSADAALLTPCAANEVMGSVGLMTLASSCARPVDSV